MRFILMAGIALALVPAGEGHAQVAQADYSYLVNATNRIYEISSRGGGLGEEELAQVLATACQALRQLGSDPGFPADLRRLATLGADTRSARAGIGRDLVMFFDAFLIDEVELLRQAGMSEISIRYLAASVAAMRGEAGTDLDPDRLVQRLTLMQEDTCIAAGTAGLRLASAEDRRLWRRRLLRIGIGLGGLAMVGADVAAIAANPVLAAMSGALGAAMVEQLFADPAIALVPGLEAGAVASSGGR